MTFDSQAQHSPLHQLADLAGIVSEYHDIWGNVHTASDATRISLLQILIDIQAAQHWISPENIDLLAAELNLPRARVEGFIGFYSFLHDQPVGQFRLLFSDNITDRMLGQPGSARIPVQQTLAGTRPCLGGRPGFGRHHLRTTA